jgi:hypothetical protein
MSRQAAELWMAQYDAQPFIIMGMRYAPTPGKPGVNGFRTGFAKFKPIALADIRLRDPATNAMPIKLVLAAGVYSECIQDYFKNIVPVEII